jgi:hypothetical protein
LESVLGATPQEFESLILRHVDVQELSMMAVGMQASWVATPPKRAPYRSGQAGTARDLGAGRCCAPPDTVANVQTASLWGPELRWLTVVLVVLAAAALIDLIWVGYQKCRSQPG